jgi:hypothetical protein
LSAIRIMTMCLPVSPLSNLLNNGLISRLPQ